MKNAFLKYLSSFMLVTVFFTSGCANTASKRSNLDTLYSRAAGHYSIEHKYAKPVRNPVIVIPGLLGSKLQDQDTGTIVWGCFSCTYANPETAKGARLAALPMQKDKSLKELKDNVSANGALDKLDLNIFMLPFRLNAYYNILKILGVGGYRDKNLSKAGTVKYPEGHFTSFQFDYDWRRDIVENAALLDEFIKKQRLYVQKEIEKRFGIKDYNVKFDIVAHSMGGLIARYYLRYGSEDLPADGSLPKTTWYGAKYISKLVMVGTPNAGSISSFNALVNGFKKDFLMPNYPPAVLGTMPSFYQLMPHHKHGSLVDKNFPDSIELDILDPTLWETMEWGLASPKESKTLAILLPDIKDKDQRREIALDHQRKCLARTKQFWEALDVPGTPPKEVTLDLFAGDAINTDAVIAVDKNKGTIEVIKKAPGDGTVLRSSALMDERISGEWSPKLVSPIKWNHVMFLFTDHLGITEDPTFSDNILYYLLEHPE